MVRQVLLTCVVVGLALHVTAMPGVGQESGGVLRGIVTDKDFDAPLPGAKIAIVELGRQITGSEQGNFTISNVPPGKYTLIFTKPDYTRQVKADVVVQAGQITEVNMALTGEFAEMDELVVQDLKLGGGTEVGLLNLRFDSSALMDSISSELMSQAGASDAAAALNLVAGASVQDGKFAVIRGLPDRYVSSQMNGVRLPSSDEDTRAVQLDLFPSIAIESIRVSKTFTPDQQGDSSGGAVNVVLKGIPDEAVLQFSSQVSFNTQAGGRNDFLTYRGGGVGNWGIDDGGRDIPSEFFQPGGGDGIYGDAVGVSRTDSPIDHKWSMTAGGKYELENGIKIGGLASVFYERDSSFFDDGIDDSMWIESPGAAMTPQISQGTVSQGEFKTSLFDVTQSSQEVKWGGLGVVGLEMEDHALKLLYLYSRATEDKVTLAEDTRGKEFFFPGHDPFNPSTPGHDESLAAPYLRNETLAYTERTSQTLQLNGRHTLPVFEDQIIVEDYFSLLRPEFDWTVARSSADTYQPDKRQFGTLWTPGRSIVFDPNQPPFVINPTHSQSKSSATFTLGNLQRVWKEISEESEQYNLNIKFPFKQWSDDEGYVKFGIFSDQVDRQYNQDSFSNFNDAGAEYFGEFDDLWSAAFPLEVHRVTPANIDVDYKGAQDIFAWYSMIDLPLTPYLNVIGGARFESTQLSIVNDAESGVTWIPPGSTTEVVLNPGDADVDFEQDDVLPSLGMILKPTEEVTLRLSYSRTIARQTFKELTPIQQQEYLGADIFIGNPDLQMSSLKNYDIRIDYAPYEGGLVSFSYFYKDLKDPIEYVQRVVGFTYTTPVNFPKGKLSGYEIEVRQKMGHFFEELEGLTIGANATFISSEVTLSEEEKNGFLLPNINVPISTRDATNAPEHLYNIYLTYDWETTGTQFALFYTVKGDTLVAGAGQSSGNFVPDVYSTEYGTLNMSVTQKIGEYVKLRFQAKNLTNPDIKEVYRPPSGGDVTKTSYTKGIDLSIGISVEFRF